MARDNSNDRNIVDFLQSKPVRSTFAAPALLEGYWEALAEEKSVPFRSQLDPRAMEPVLEYAFVLERLAPGVCRFRLAGRHLNDLMGQEVRGMPATAMFEPESRKDISRLLEKVCTTACLVDVSLSAQAGFGRGALQARLFLAPLCDDQGRVTRVLGCLQSQGTIGRQPRRFSVTQATTKPTDYSVIRLALPIAIPQSAFAETAPSFEHQPKEAHEIPATGLKLVVDNS